MDKDIDYRTKSDEPTRQLLGTALLHWARRYRDHQHSNKPADELEVLTWKMKCKEADVLVRLYEEAHESGRLYLPVLPPDLWAGEEVLIGAAIHFQMNLAVWDDLPATTAHREIFKVHDDCQMTYQNTIFLNQVFYKGVRCHFDLKHHPNPVFQGVGSAHQASAAATEQELGVDLSSLLPIRSLDGLDPTIHKAFEEVILKKIKVEPDFAKKHPTLWKSVFAKLLTDPKHRPTTDDAVRPADNEEGVAADKDGEDDDSVSEDPPTFVYDPDKHFDKTKLDDAPARYIISTAVKSGKNFTMSSMHFTKLKGNQVFTQICLDALDDYNKVKGQTGVKGQATGGLLVRNEDNEKLFTVSVFVK